MSDLRTGLLGYGMAGATIHAPAISVTDGLELAAIVTRNPERAAAAAEQHPHARIAASIDELWNDGLDLLVIATPNRWHVPLALAAIEHGLAVVIDKPVAATAEDARRVVRAADTAGVPVSVFHNRRWEGSSKTLRDLVQSNALGRVHRFEARIDRWRPEVTAGAWREGSDPQDAGGLLYDLGSHLIDQALTLFGPVTTVYAEVRAVRPGAQVDDDVFLALTHASGTISHLWASSVAANLGPWLRVLGSAASYTKELPDAVDAWGLLGTPGATQRLPTQSGGYEGYYADVLTALAAGAPPPVTIEEAIDVMVVIEAAQLSARIGTSVSL